MWTRRELKEYAKDFLRKNYWKAFLVVLITTLLMNGFGNNNGANSTAQIKQNYEYITEQGTNVTVSVPYGFELIRSALSNLKPFGFLAIGTITFISIVLSIGMLLLGFIVEVGKSKFFIDGFNGDVDISKLFFGFNSKDAMPIIKAQGLASIYIFLWTLLLIIPGIIKGYEYRYVPYLLAEDTSLSPKEVLDKSKQMTMGHKLDIFVLDLSFILWGLLSFVTFGLSSFFVAPYIEATNARLYNVLKEIENSLEY